MKHFRICACLLFLATSVSTAWGTSSISGTVSYNGSHTGTIYVALFTEPISCTATNPHPLSAIQLSEMGSYQISGLSDGNYYVASVIMTCGSDCALSITDPWGVYNGCNNITPVTIKGTSVSNVNVALVDGTVVNPNPFVKSVKSYYLSVTGNSSGTIGFQKSNDELSFFSVDLYGDGGFGRFGNGESGVEAILPFGTHSPPIKHLKPMVGQTWSDTGDSNGYQINSVAEVQSVNVTIKVAAGTFTGCVHVSETLSWPFGYNRLKYPVGYDRWFCPGIGPVKLIISDNFGENYLGELTAYNLTNVDTTDYFPLEPSYQWTFKMDDNRSATWIVNAIAPDVVMNSKPPNPDIQNTGTFIFSSTNPEATFECELDATSFSVCHSPYSYSNLSTGSHTFSVRAKDSAGYVTVDPVFYSWNIISTSLTKTLSITPNGTGSGSVNSNPSGLIACTYPPQSGKCNVTQQVNTQLTLIATPSDDSLFGGWGSPCNDCSGLSCLVTLNSDKSCAITFLIKPLVQIAGPTYFASINKAYTQLLDEIPAVMKAQAVELTEEVDFNRNIPLTFEGGFDTEFTNILGYSTLHGVVKLSKGSLLANRLIIK